MRHLKEGKKFGRKKGQRKAFLKALVNNLINHEKIVTTETRAKAIRPIIERLITHAKKQSLASLRLIVKRLSNKRTAFKLYHEIAPRYFERNGGYVRVKKLSRRRLKDGSRLAVIEFV